jgi:hypothetical protein
MVRNSIWAAFFLLNLGAHASFTQMYCEKVISQYVRVSRSGKTFQLVMRDQNTQQRDLLQSLLPTLPAKTLQSYRCVRYTLQLPEKICTFETSPVEAFKCEWTATDSAELTVEAKTSCYGERGWDTYRFEFDKGSIESFAGGTKGKETLQFRAKLEKAGDKYAHLLNSVEFTDHTHWIDGVRQDSECSVDGRRH